MSSLLPEENVLYSNMSRRHAHERSAEGYPTPRHAIGSREDAHKISGKPDQDTHRPGGQIRAFDRPSGSQFDRPLGSQRKGQRELNKTTKRL